MKKDQELNTVFLRNNSRKEKNGFAIVSYICSPVTLTDGSRYKIIDSSILWDIFSQHVHHAMQKKAVRVEIRQKRKNDYIASLCLCHMLWAWVCIKDNFVVIAAW